MCDFLFMWYHIVLICYVSVSIYINQISVLLNLSLLCSSLAAGAGMGGRNIVISNCV